MMTRPDKCFSPNKQIKPKQETFCSFPQSDSLKESCNKIRSWEQVSDPNNIMDRTSRTIQDKKRVVGINLIMLVKLSVLTLLGNEISLSYGCKKLQSKDFRNVLVFACNMIAGMLAGLLARISIRNLLSNIYNSGKKL